MYNVVFDNDDDKAEVEIVEQDTIVQTSPEPDRPTIRDSLNEIKQELKKTGELLKDEATVVVNDLKKELQETKPEEEEQPKEKPPEEMIAEPEKLKPLNDAKEKPTGMKKL